METRATVEFTSDKEKVLLPALSVDFFFGKMKPNQVTIDSDHYKFEEGFDHSQLQENQIVTGIVSPYERTMTSVKIEE